MKTAEEFDVLFMQCGTVTNVAKMCKVSRQTIYDWTKKIGYTPIIIRSVSKTIDVTPSTTVGDTTAINTGGMPIELPSLDEIYQFIKNNKNHIHHDYFMKIVKKNNPKQAKEQIKMDHAKLEKFLAIIKDCMKNNNFLYSNTQ